MSFKLGVVQELESRELGIKAAVRKYGINNLNLSFLAYWLIRINKVRTAEI